MKLTEKCIEQVDDSCGQFGVMWSELARLHLLACQMSRPDGVALAQRLFAHAVSSGWYHFSDAPQVYQQIFGEAGMAEWKRLADLAFRGLPQLRPNEKDPRGFRSRTAITALRAAVAQASGDIDDLVWVMSRDLSSAHRYITIAELLQRAGRLADAEGWARKGLEFSWRDGDSGLQSFLDQLLSQRSHTQA